MKRDTEPTGLVAVHDLDGPVLRACCRCPDLTDCGIAVGQVAVGGRPPVNLYACPDCAPEGPR